MKPNKICTRSFIVAMALAAVFALAAAWPCASSAAGPTECGLIGTWYGETGYALRWLGVHTAGSTITRGEMLLDWNRVSPSLLNVYGQYPDATRLTGGRGVWEMTARNEYKYTWYAYGIGTTGPTPIYSVRVSGLARNINCNNVEIDFIYEVFDGFVLPQDMSTPDRVMFIQGYAAELRVPLTVVPWTEPTP